MKFDIADKFLITYVLVSSIILFILGMKLGEPSKIIGDYYFYDPWQIPAVMLLFVIVFLPELIVVI